MIRLKKLPVLVPIALAALMASCRSKPKEIGPAPASFRVKFATTKGDFVVLVHRDWSPRGADRFYRAHRVFSPRRLFLHGAFCFYAAHPKKTLRIGIFRRASKHSNAHPLPAKVFL